MNKLLSLILLPVLSISAMSTRLTREDSILASQNLGNIVLHHKQDGFYVEHNNNAASIAESLSLFHNFKL